LWFLACLLYGAKNYKSNKNAAVILFRKVSVKAFLTAVWSGLSGSI